MGDIQKEHLDRILQILNLKKYYRSKFFWKNAVTIRDTSSSIGSSIVEHIFMLDHRAHLAFMEECDVGGMSIHPMDVMNVIYNCCDSLLLQQLMEERIQCQMSIPLVLPDAQSRRSTFLISSLKSILTKMKGEHFEDKRETTFDEPLKIISFMRIGEPNISKSKLLNKLFNIKYRETFFNRDCEYGKPERVISGGTVEASWLFTSEEKSNEDMFTILNLRGDAMRYVEEFQLLGAVSNLSFILIDLDFLGWTDYKDLLESTLSLQSKFILIIVSNTLNKCKRLKYDITDGQLSLKHNKVLRFKVLQNWKRERLLEYEEISEMIRQVVVDMAKKQCVSRTVADLEQALRVSKFDMDENDSCNDTYVKAKGLMEMIIDDTALKNTPSTYFPLQGSAMWEKFQRLKKNQHCDAQSPRTVENHVARMEMKQSHVREHQFRVLENDRLSKFMRSFASYLVNDRESRCNLVHLMQVMMRKWHLKTASRQCLVNYTGDRTEKTDQSGDSASAETIVDVTCFFEATESKDFISLEHVFREFGQMYECVRHHNGTIPESLKHILHFPCVMADLMLNGVPFELMDGRETAIPIPWVTAVFEAVKEIIGDKKVFVISVLGPQSSGKSTLLNTIVRYEVCSVFKWLCGQERNVLFNGISRIKEFENTVRLRNGCQIGNIRFFRGG